jgi:hypothetical protein
MRSSRPRRGQEKKRKAAGPKRKSGPLASGLLLGMVMVAATLIGGLLGFVIRRRPPASPVAEFPPRAPLTPADHRMLAIAAISALANVVSAAAAVLMLIYG